MLNKRVIEGKNKEEAIAQLNADDIILCEEEKSSLFKSKYTITTTSKKDVIALIKEYFSKLSKYMNIELNIEIKEFENTINVNIISDNNAIIIGKQGKNLESLQHFIRTVISENTNNQIKVNVDVCGYKAKKIDILKRDVKKVIKEVLNSHVDAKLDPMNSYERMIIHNLVDKYDNLTTESVGEEPERCVVIKYKEN